MALNKEIETQYGINASYWKITYINTDWMNKRMNIILEGFLDKSARENRRQSLDRRNISVENIEPTDNLVEKGYLEFKDKEFSDAKDC